MEKAKKFRRISVTVRAKVVVAEIDFGKSGRRSESDRVLILDFRRGIFRNVLIEIHDGRWKKSIRINLQNNLQLFRDRLRLIEKIRTANDQI